MKDHTNSLYYSKECSQHDGSSLIVFQIKVLCLFIYRGSHCLNFFNLLAQKPNLEKNSILYSNKFFHIFHLFESSFTCHRLQGSGLAQRL